MTGPQLADAIRKDINLAHVLNPGELGIYPAGYLFLMYSKIETMVLRWSLNFHPSSGEDSTVQKVLASLLEAQPGLRATAMHPLFEYLQAKSSKPAA